MGSSSLISRIYSNPANARSAYDVTASSAANAKLKKKAFQPHPLSASEQANINRQIGNAINQLRSVSGPSVERTKQSLQAADQIIFRILKGLRKRRSASGERVSDARQ